MDQDARMPPTPHSAADMVLIHGVGYLVSLVHVGDPNREIVCREVLSALPKVNRRVKMLDELARVAEDLISTNTGAAHMEAKRVLERMHLLKFADACDALHRRGRVQ